MPSMQNKGVRRKTSWLSQQCVGSSRHISTECCLEL